MFSPSITNRGRSRSTRIRRAVADRLHQFAIHAVRNNGRAELNIVAAICGSIGAAVTGCQIFGYGEAADKAYVVDVCRMAFGDQTTQDVDRRTKALLERAKSLMEPEMRTLSAVAEALRARRRLTKQTLKRFLQRRWINRRAVLARLAKL